MEKVAVIILNWNGYKDTIELLQTLFEFDKNHHFFILDNGSSNDSVVQICNYLNTSKWEYQVVNLDSFDTSKTTNVNYVTCDINYGFAKGNNIILEKIRGQYDYYVLLNNDVIFDDSSITKLVSYAKDNNIDAISPRINRHCDNSLWYGGGKLTLFGERKYFSEHRINKTKDSFIRCSFITGCLLCINNNTLNEIGGLTEDFFYGEEDFQYSYKLHKQKKKVGVILNTTIYHKVSASSGTLPKMSMYSLHFINRIVDKKILYNRAKFLLWRTLYLKALFFRTLMLFKSYKIAKEILHCVKTFSSRDNVRYDTFLEIVNYKWSS